MVSHRWVGFPMLALVGCYEAVPIATATPQPNREIVVQLTDSGSQELARIIGPGATEVRGRYLDSSTDSLRLAVLGVTGRNQEERFWNLERVAIPRLAVGTLRERRLSRTRTGVVAVLAIAAAALVKVGFDGNPGNTGNLPEPPLGGK